MERGEGFGCSASKEVARSSGRKPKPSLPPMRSGCGGNKDASYPDPLAPGDTWAGRNLRLPRPALRPPPRPRSPPTNAGLRHFRSEQQPPALNRNRKAGPGRHSTCPSRSWRGNVRLGPAQEGSADGRQAPGVGRHRADAGVRSAPPAPLKMPDSTWRRALRPVHPAVSSRAGKGDDILGSYRLRIARVGPYLRVRQPPNDLSVPCTGSAWLCGRPFPGSAFPSPPPRGGSGGPC